MGIYTQSVQQLYVAYFSRPADPSGLQYWEGVVAQNNGSTAAVSAAFSQSPEYTAAFAGMNNNQIVNQIYLNLFGRSAEPAGLNFWSYALDTGRMTVSNAVTAIAAGAQGSDMTAYNDKVAGATSFTNSIDTTPEILAYSGDAANTTARTWLAGITDDASLAAAETTKDGVISDITTGGSNPGTPVTLTTGADTVTGMNVAITGIVDGTAPPANNSTSQVFDSINPTGTNNSLTLKAVGGGVINGATTATLNNVQTLNVTPITGTTADASIGPNLTTLGMVGGTPGGAVNFINVNGLQTNNFNLSNVNNVAENMTVVTLAGLTGSNTANVTLNNVLSNTPGIGNDATLNLVGAAAGDGFSAVSLHSAGATDNRLTSLTDATLKTLTVDGAAKLTIDTPVVFTGTKADVQAGTDTGGLSIDVSAGGTTNVTFAGGSGVNSLIINEASLINASTSLNGGTGTHNTLGVAGFAGSAADYTALQAEAGHGFQILGLVDAGGDTVNAGTGGLNNAFTHFSIGATNVGLANTISNLSSGSTVDVLSNTGAVDNFTPVAGGTNVLNLNIGDSTTAGVNGVTFNTGAFATVNLTSNGTAANGGVGILNFVSTGAADYNLAGSNDLTASLNAGGSADTFDAHGFTGKLNLADTGFGDTITTGSGAATINENGLGDTVSFGAGNGVVDTLASNILNASTTQFDHVSNFALNQDVLTTNGGPALVQGTGADLAGVSVSNGIVLSSTYANATAFITAVEASATAGVGDTVAWSDGSNTYVAEWSAAGANSAHIVELVGVTGATAIGGAGAGNIAIA